MKEEKSSTLVKENRLERGSRRQRWGPLGDALKLNRFVQILSELSSQTIGESFNFDTQIHEKWALLTYLDIWVVELDSVKNLISYILPGIPYD